jgi:hypothetical protein
MTADVGIRGRARIRRRVLDFERLDTGHAGRLRARGDPAI